MHVQASGRGTADQAYDTLRGMEKDKQVDIKTAMVVCRKDNGKLKLKHKRRLTVKKGMVAGGAVGLPLGAAAAPAIVDDMQAQPFILHPVELPANGEMVGAADVYKLCKGWLNQLQKDS